MKQGDWKINRSPSQTPQGRKDYYNILKEKCFDLIGHKCKFCGFSDKRALQFDHINSDGAEDRKKYSGTSYFHFLLKNENKFQTLCANCNWIKRHENKEIPDKYPKNFKFPTEPKLKHHEKNYKEKQCKHCNKTFTPKSSGQFFCNPNCRD